MIDINYYFNPLRLVISRKEPTKLVIELENRDISEKEISVAIVLPKELAFGKGKFKRDLVERFKGFKPQEKKILTYEIFPNIPYIRPGEYKIKLVVSEYTRPNIADRQQVKELTLIVS
ncbi:MAG: hypothetical protein N3D73_02125 [Candidatus Diapherotrites archaeon]|nr:hypothetical protein [Candidatus Diapherotrites archaeon]